MNQTDELQAARDAIICSVNTAFDRLIKTLDGNGADNHIEATERMALLSSDPSLFRGTKPIALLFADERIDTPTWRKVFETVLRRCVQDSRYHDNILGLRNKAAGKCRVFLSHHPDTMRRPVEICSEMFAETHYGSETLMHILCKRILEPASFDCSTVTIIIRS